MADDGPVVEDGGLCLEQISARMFAADRLLLMVEAMAHVGHWRHDLLCGQLFWSDEVKRIYGRPLDYTPNMDDALGAYGPGESERERVVAIVRETLTSGKGFSFESQIAAPNGTVRDVRCRGHVERDASGAIVAILGILEDLTERKQTERERDRLLERITLANTAGNIGVWDFDIATGTVVWDKTMFALYGLDEHVPALQEAFSAALHPADRTRVLAELDAAIANSASIETEFRVVWPNGDVHTICSLATVMRDALGVAVRMIGTNWDISEVRTLSEALRTEKDALLRSELRYRALTEAMPQLVWVIDADRRFEYVNERWTKYTGFTLEEMRVVGRERTLDSADIALIDAFRDSVPPKEFECEVRLRRHDGVFRYHLFRSVPFSDGAGGCGKWIVSATDIEDRKNAETRLARAAAELAHLAHHDAMTDLPNRTLLMDRLSESLAWAERNATGVMVLYLDLDRFKNINDRLGHAAGDRVLAEIGSRIAGALRAGDTASRVGGDEFVLVCVGRDDAEALAARLLVRVAEPIEIDGTTVVIGASIGISHYPGDALDADALVCKADAAMYAAKQSGRNAFRTYVPQMNVSLAAMAEFEAELQTAIAQQQFEVFYQPMISLRTGLLIGAEALVRWRHPRRGLLSPGAFVPFAEEHGFITLIGDLVLQEACAQLGRLELAGDAEFSLAVNVSAHQFERPEFVQKIAAAIAMHDVDVKRLEIEITESTVMGNTSATVAILTDLKALGVRLSLDDFGTGYSSLAYIKNFPIDTLKIDRTFVRDVATNRTDQALAKTIITLAHSLGMRVVGEGVETYAQLDVLRRFGADICQGFLISHPLPGAEFANFVRTYAPLALPAA